MTTPPTETKPSRSDTRSASDAGAGAGADAGAGPDNDHAGEGPVVETPWADDAEAVARALDTDPDQGLTAEEVTQRRERYGENLLRRSRKRPWYLLLLDQFRSIVIYILAAAALIAFVTGHLPEGFAVVAVLIVNTTIGFVTEYKAIKSMEALRRQAKQMTRVRRGGEEQTVPVSEVVPGDVVLLEAGDLLPADLRLVRIERLRVNESALTGESVPVDKLREPVDADTGLADRTNMGYMGTAVSEGTAEGVVVATGSRTELGQIATLAEEATSDETPLEKRLNELGGRLAWITIGIAVVIAVSGLLMGRDVRVMIETSIALGVAAIPEGLPIVATIALARGMHRMSKRNALINRLAAVETLGGTHVIFTDKTGTITENRMTLRRVATPAVEQAFDHDGIRTVSQEDDEDTDDVQAEARPHAEQGPEDATGEPGGAGRADGESTQDEANDADPLVRRVVELGVLCNTATLGDGPEESPGRHAEADEDDDSADDEEGGNGNGNGDTESHGDPTELALLAAGRRLGFERATLLDRLPEARLHPFDPVLAKMASVHELVADGDQAGDRFVVAVKGAPEAVLNDCTRIAIRPAASEGEAEAAGDRSQDPDVLRRSELESEELNDDVRREWLERTDRLASQGLRLLGLAERRMGSKDEDPYQDLTFVGLVGLLDPPREDVKGAIEECHRAGVRVIMATGDKPETGRAIAEAVGIGWNGQTRAMHARDVPDPDSMTDDERQKVLKIDVFARVSPEQKLNLIAVHQREKHVVAMTGDGVNDAPALKKANIGIAMGQRGTEAAKQVADMVLTDDRFRSIVEAVREGRVIFNNIRKSVMFMLCTNGAEVTAVALASFTALPLPLRPLQILYLNVLTDVFPALALGVGAGAPGLMQRPPRQPGEHVLTRAHWIEIAGWSVLIALCVLTGMWISGNWLGLSANGAITVSFLILAFGKLWFTFALRDPTAGIFRNEITRNPWIWIAVVWCIALLLAAVYLPGLNDLLQTEYLPLSAWGLIFGMSLIPLLAGQIVREIQRWRLSRQKER